MLYDAEDKTPRFKFIVFDYKIVVFEQEAAGSFKKGILELVKEDEELMKAKQAYKNEKVLLTILALFLLMKHFKSDKSKWILVANKAKKFLVSAMGLNSTKEVDQIIEKMNLKPI